MSVNYPGSFPVGYNGEFSKVKLPKEDRYWPVENNISTVFWTMGAAWSIFSLIVD
jgi:hypothetical protein